jgi:cytochrome c oxidase subunit 3
MAQNTAVEYAQVQATVAEHAHHWETSPYPLVITAGILFALPFAFALKFAYHQPLAAVLSLGLGVPLVVAGVAGWVREAIGGHGEGLAFPAMGWFILAEAMIFVSFFASYWFMRLTAPEWPPAGTVELPKVMPLVMTGVLVASSLTIHHGEALLHRGSRKGYVTWLLVTIALGLAFLGMSAYEWSHLMHQGFAFETNAYSTAFFSITGFHGAHVIIGLGIFVAVLLPALRGRLNHGFVRTAGLYWHFVDIIWFFVVSQVYYW